MSCYTRPIKWVHCDEDGPISERSTEIEIINEGDGEFVCLHQYANTKSGTIAIDGQEWPTLKDAITAAFAEIAKHEQKP